MLMQALTHQPTGALVAAATAAGPDHQDGSGGWDYRYGWLRDASLVARALRSSRCSDESRHYFDWMSHAAMSCSDTGHVQIVFGIGGERDLTERTLEHFEDTAGSVKIGNDAWRQRQLDVYGEVLDVAWGERDLLEDSLDDQQREFLCDLADRAAADWGEPDAGVWETREHPRHFVASKLMC